MRVAIVGFFFCYILLEWHVSSKSYFISEVPVLVMYSGRQCTGRNITLEAENEYSLKNKRFNNRAYSIQASGTWLFYEQEFFNSFTDGRVYHYYDETHKCQTLPKLGGRISSARFAGVPWHYKDEALIIYELDEFQGDEERVERDHSDIALKHQASLIMTGPWPWTLYDQPGFQGNAMCLEPLGNGKPLFIQEDIYSHVPFELIRSVRLGCFA